MIFIILTSLFLSGCADKNYVAFHGSNGPALTVSGTASMFKTSQSSQSVNAAAATCTTATASLHGVNLNGTVQDAALATTPIAVDGSFRFSSVQIKDINLNSSSSISYVIKASGCNSTYYRPLTNYAGQNITNVSTLFTMSSEVADTGRRNLNTVSRSEIENAISQFVTVNANDTLANVLQAIISTPSLSQEFQTVTNIAPVKLKETPPTSLEVTAPLELSEASVNTYNVEIHHWNPEYVAAYEWLIDGQVVSTNSSFQYNTTKNSQGNHNLILKVGVRKIDGSLDVDKSIKSESYVLKVADTFPAIAPTLTLTSGTPPVSHRALTMNIDTGAAKINCATFSGLALTEDVSVAPTEFPINCSTAGLQNLSYTSVSPNDGLKTLRLWAVDSAGNVSVNPTTLLVIIDTSAPVVTIAGAPAAINNAASLSINFSATDANAVLSYSCKLDSGSFAACSSPKSYSGLAQGSHSFSVKAVDSVANESIVVVSSWTTDLTIPTVNITGSAPAINNQLTNTFTFSGNDTGGGTVAGYLCSFDAAAFSSCSSPKLEMLAPGSHSFQVKSVDTAGNISTVQSSSFIIDTTVPTVSITSQPVSLTNSPSANFNFTGSDTGGGTIAGFECSKDGSSYSACTSPQNLTGLASGAHVFSVKSHDTAGNLSNAATYSWTIDLTTPIPNISSSPGNITNSATAVFSFSANNPPSGTITGYECKLDSGAYGACSSPLTFTSLTQGNHTFNVRSIDNNSSASAATTLTWLIDLTKPVATIDAYPSSVNANTAASIYFSATDTGGATVTTFQCKLDGASYAACSSPVSFSSLAESSHTFSVKVSDSAANISDVVSTTWSTDLTGPTTNIIASPLALTNSTTATLTFSASDSGGGTVASTECSLDGAAYALCSSPRGYSSLAPGAHTFSVRSTDSVNNLGLSTSSSWTIDTSPPSVNISSAPALNANSTSAVFQFAGTDTGGGAIASYQCSIDGATYVTCTSPKSYSSLSEGAHTFEVKAIDTAGNTGSASISTWTIDITAPITTITTPATNATVISASQISSYTFSGACESGRTVTFSGISTTTTTCTASAWTMTLNLSTANEGSLSLTATQSDAAGNVGSATRTFIKDTTAPVINFTVAPTVPVKGSSAFAAQFTVTEANISTSQNFIVESSIDNGSTWTTWATVASVAGPLSSRTFSATNNFTNVNSTQVKLRVSGSDIAGNAAIPAVSSAFTVDSNAPALTNFVVNGGTATSVSSSIPLAFRITDNFKSTDFCIRYNSTAAPSSSDSCWTSVAVAGSTAAAVVNVSNYTFRVGLTSATYTISLWSRDEAGNISTLTQTTGVDTGTVSYVAGTPPQVVSVLATGTSSPSTPPSSTDLTAASGSTVYVQWQITSTTGLASNGIDLYYTTDDVTWNTLASGLTEGTNGGCSLQGSNTGCYVWTSSSPTSSFFRVRAKATDTQGFSALNSSIPMNANVLRFLAGNTETGTNGSATAAVFLNTTQSDNRRPDSRSLVVHPNGTVYFRDGKRGILKVDPADGILKVFIPLSTSSTGDGGPATSATVRSPVAIALDAQNNLLIYDYTTIRKVNLALSTPTISTIIGGTATLTSADNVPNALNLAISSNAITDAKDSNLSVLPNGDIFFRTESLGGSSNRLRWFHASTNSITTVYFAGQGIITQAPTIDVAICGQFPQVPILDSSGALKYFLVQILISPTGVGSCTYDTGYHNINALFSTTGAFIQNISTTGGVGDTSALILGRDLKTYGFGRSGLLRFDLNTSAWVSVNAAGSGICADGTAFTSCAVNTEDFFIDPNSKIYYVENGRIRTVNDSGNVQSILGQGLFYGDGSDPLQARFRTIASIGMWNDGTDDRVISLDNGNHRLREFKLNSSPTISTIAGLANSGIPSLSLQATTQPIRDQSSSSNGYIFGLTSNGNVYMSVDYAKFGFLNRSTGIWNLFAGGGATNYYTGDGSVATSISYSDKGNQYPLILGNSSTEVLLHVSQRNGGTYDYNSIKRVNVSTLVQSSLAGVTTTGNSGSWCANGVTLTSCLVPPAESYPTPHGPAIYDTIDGAWLIGYESDNTIRKLVPGGTMQTYVTMPNNFRGYALRKSQTSGTVTEEILYWCDRSSAPYKLKKTNMLTATTTALTWPINSISCDGYSLIYSASRNSLIFSYSRGGLYGIAEYLNP